MMRAMQTRTPRTAGLSPTIRQLMILVLCVGMHLAAFTALLRDGFLGATPDQICGNAALFFAGWPVLWMIVLLFFLDQRGPIRSWYIARCFASWGLVAVPPLLLADPVSWVLCGRLTMGFPILAIAGLVCLVALPSSLRSVQPGRCVHCGRKSIIVVVTKLDTRMIRHDVGWCASCGADYEREKLGQWMAMGSEGVEE